MKKVGSSKKGTLLIQGKRAAWAPLGLYLCTCLLFVPLWRQFWMWQGSCQFPLVTYIVTFEDELLSSHEVMLRQQIHVDRIKKRVWLNPKSKQLIQRRRMLALIQGPYNTYQGPALISRTQLPRYKTCCQQSYRNFQDVAVNQVFRPLYHLYQSVLSHSYHSWQLDYITYSYIHFILPSMRTQNK